MGLNTYRDEVCDFLDGIDTRDKPISQVMEMLDEEVTLLKGSLDNRERLSHKIYDLLFLPFEITAIHNLDMDAAWTKGKEKKQARYLESD